MLRALQTIVWMAALALATCCASKGARPTSPAILDQVLTSKNVKARVRAVERDLPGDKWITGGATRPGRYNVSRSGREADLAHELLLAAEPKVRAMSARQLLDSLKTFPYPEYDSFPGVAGYVYRDGNQMILHELNSKPMADLQTLRAFRDDRRSVFTGDNGSPLSVGELVRYKLLHEPM
jgi:hypothetical protein